MVTAVSIKNLSVEYHDGHTAIHDLTFDLPPQARLGLIGPNGAGKTSLILALCGLVHAHGTIKIAERDLDEQSAPDLRKGISLVFQNPDDQLFMPTAFEDVAFGLKELGCSSTEIRQRVQIALSQVHLTGFEERSAHHLSYGERRALTLAAAFARQPSLLIMDEPSRELDPGSRKELVALLKDQVATQIIASHDLDIIAALATHVLLLDGGRSVAFGDPDSILSDATLMEQHRLEVPRMYL